MKVNLGLDNPSALIGRSLGKTIEQRSPVDHSIPLKELSVVSSVPKDIVDLKSTASNSNNRDLKRLYASNGKLVEFEYSDKDKSTSAYIIDINDQRLAIKPENLPRELGLIQNPIAFHKFLSAMHIRTSVLSDGGNKLYISGRILGGMDNGDIKVEERDLRTMAVEMNTLLARAIIGPYSDSKYSQISMVISFVQENIQSFNPSQLHKRVILLMGPTGVGKSTLVNYIAGRNMIVRESPSGFGLYPEDPIAHVGQGNGSTTLLPNVWSADIDGFEGVSFVDCAGDFDTSGVVIESINAMIKQKIASTAQQVKIVIVGTQGSLTAEGSYGAVFKEGLAKSAQFLGNIADFRENIALIVSHSTRRSNVLTHINNALASILGQAGNPLADYREIIQYIQENQRFTYFCKPDDETEDGETYSSPASLNQKESITNLIKDRISFKDVQAGSYFQTSASREVQQTMDSAIAIVKQKSVNVLRSHIDSIMSTKLRINSTGLATLSTALERTISIDDTLTLSDYVTRFNENAFLPNITRESINQLPSELEFLSRFARIPETNNWGSAIDIRRSFNAMTTEIGKIIGNSPDVFSTRFSHHGNSVNCIGYTVNMSEVAQFVSGKANIAEVRLFALNEVIIDSNLITPSINVCIIAPKWTIPAGTTINLSGLDNNSYPDNRQKADNGIVYGANGTDGKPGLPGFSGGNFLGIGNEFIGLNNLTVISNGGRGGPGQYGGDGYDGADKSLLLNYDDIYWSDNLITRDASSFREKVRYDNGKLKDQWRSWWVSSNDQDVAIEVLEHKPHIDLSGDPQNPLPVIEKVVFKAKFILPKGHIGGIAGKGGKAGKGGLSGNIKIYNLRDSSSHNCRVSQDIGGEGANGAVGTNGLYGQGEEKVVRITHSYPAFRKDRSSISIVTQDRISTELRNPAVVEGTNDSNILLPQLINFNPNSSQTNYLGFVLSTNSRLKRFDILDSTFINSIKESSFFKIQGISDLISQSIMIEENFSLQHSDSYLSFYQSLKKNIKEFYEQNAENLTNGDVRVLNYIYSLACSSVCRFNASRDTVLVVNIRTFFAGVQRDITNLQTLESQRIKDSYKTNYNGNISNKIKEAENFVTLLLGDIDKYKSKIDDNIVSLINEIETLKEKVHENTTELLRKREELKNALAIKQLLGGLNIVSQALGFAGPLGSAVGGILSSGLEIASGFALNESGQPANVTIPEGVYAGINDIGKHLSAQKAKALAKLAEELRVLEVQRQLERLPSVPSDNLPFSPDSARSFEERLQSLKEEKSDSFILGIELRLEKLKGGNPERVAKLEQDIQIAKDLEFAETEADLKNKQQQASDKEARNLARLQKVAVAANVAKAAVDLYRTTQASQSQIKEIENAISGNSAKVEALDKRISQVLEMHSSMIGSMKQEIDTFNQNLQNKSHVALDVDKWNIKKSLSEIKTLVEDFTKGFKAESALGNTIQRLQECIETLIGIYDRVQSYQDQVEFSNYISSINSSIIADDIPAQYQTNVNKIRTLIQRNIVTEQYNRAMKAFSQWAFPFVEDYLQELKSDLPDCRPILSYEKTEEDIIRQMTQVIERLEQKIQESEAVVKPKIDNIRFDSTFDNTKPFSPFFEWSYEQNPEEMANLLKGEEVTLIADVRSSIHDAIKFATIGIEITNSEQNIKLQQLLENFEVELTHSGISSYKYDNKIYKISSNGPSGEQINLVYQYGNIDRGIHLKHANEAYKKLRQNIPILSPYTTWKIRINPINQGDHLIFNRIPKDLSGLKISLIGHGHYVKVSETLKIPEHYKQYQAQSGGVDTAYQAQFPAYVGNNAGPQKPNIHIDHQQNAFNQRSRVGYLYQATDISFIQKQLMIDPDRFSINEPLGNNIGGNILRGIQTLIEKLEATEKTTLGVYNLGNYHWVSMAVYKKGLSTVVLYKDSYGCGNEVLAKYCEDNGCVFLFNNEREQTSGVDCGIFALNNMAILAQNLQADEPNFYISFRNNKNFCSLSTAQSLRLGHYSKLYVAGIYRNIQEEKQKAEILLGIRRSKEGELAVIEPHVSTVIRPINSSINIRILGALETLGSGVSNTITLEIATKDESFNLNARSCQYGYKISWTQDLEDSIGEEIKATIKSIPEYTFDDSRISTIICYSQNEINSVVTFAITPLQPLNVQELYDNLSVNRDSTDSIKGILRELEIDYLEEEAQERKDAQFDDSLFDGL